MSAVLTLDYWFVFVMPPFPIMLLCLLPSLWTRIYGNVHFPVSFRLKVLHNYYVNNDIWWRKIENWGHLSTTAQALTWSHKVQSHWWVMKKLICIRCWINDKLICFCAKHIFRGLGLGKSTQILYFRKSRYTVYCTLDKILLKYRSSIYNSTW